MENSFSNLILKYVPEDEIRYLESVLGSIDSFNYFTDETQVKSVINDISYLDDFFTIIHNFHDRLDDAMFDEKFQVSEDILQALRLFEDHYYKLKYASRELKYDLGKFSLDEEFNFEEGKKYQYDLNAVTVITPSSTLSRFNDNSENGLEGSGHHDENVLEIIRAVYGDNARNMRETGQDIVIRYINRASKNTQEPFMMTVEIPSKINSSQKASLQNLNDEIKKFETRTGQRIIIHSSIIDYENNRKMVEVVEAEENLDTILSKVVVNDSLSLKYEELKYDFDYPNVENHYNDSYYRLTHTIIGPKEDDLGVYSFLASHYSDDEEISDSAYNRMAGIITNKQVAFRYDTADNHNIILAELEREIFPGSNNNGFNNNFENGVLIFGVYNDIVIMLPDTITIEQYNYLEKIIEEVERFRKDYWMAKLPYYNGEDILKRAKAIITNKQDLDNDEVIVGVPIKKVDSEKTQEVVQSANNSTDQSVDGKVENLMDQIHENASQKAEEDRLMSEVYTRAEENAREYSEMYEQALKENEEFDRKKANKAREYLEMYEQALKENEEFDRRKEEERHQSLLGKEAQLRQEWKDNMSEESYYNYKNSIKDRLEYENAKKLYEGASNSNALLSEIEKINKAKHFSDETKEELISEIESSKRVK